MNNEPLQISNPAAAAARIIELETERENLRKRHLVALRELAEMKNQQDTGCGPAVAFAAFIGLVFAVLAVVGLAAFLIQHFRP